MGLLTQKEYLNLQTKKDSIKSEITTVETNSAVVVEEKKFIYILLFPENPQEHMINFEDIIVIDNKKYSRKCENGIIKTDEIILANFLIEKGYILLEKLEDFNG